MTSLTVFLQNRRDIFGERHRQRVGRSGGAESDQEPSDNRFETHESPPSSYQLYEEMNEKDPRLDRFSSNQAVQGLPGANDPPFLAFDHHSRTPEAPLSIPNHPTT